MTIVVSQSYVSLDGSLIRMFHSYRVTRGAS